MRLFLFTLHKNGSDHTNCAKQQTCKISKPFLSTKNDTALLFFEEEEEEIKPKLKKLDI